MVQQGYTKARYSARASTRKGAGATGEDVTYPAGRATVEAGLRSYALNKAEQLRFSRCTSDYREARNIVLGKWDADTTRFLTEEACLELAAPGKEGIMREAYRFLARQGAINFGLLRGDPRVPLPDEVAARLAPPPEDADPVPHGPSDDEVAGKLFDIMASVDMNLTTEKMLRQRTGEALGCDLSQRKSQIRKWVNDFLAAPGVPAWFKQKQREAKKKAREEARRRRYRVVVVGAGPAGLTAALHLKRNGADVAVLEARERVGGRVHSFQEGGFTAPVDLGASIITGTDPDVEKGLRCDPSAILCRQLGVQLHPLGEQLPLLDTATGLPVPDELDKSVEKLRDELMDDVADLLDEMPDEQKNTFSYGQLLTRAIKERAAAAEAAAAKAEAAAAGGDASGAAAPVEPAVPAAPAAPDAAAAPAAAAPAVVVPPDPEVESALALLTEPAPALAPVLLTDGLDLGAELLLGSPREPRAPRGEQEEVDDFLASVLASPSPQKPAPLAALPPPPPAAPAAAVAALAANGTADAPAGQQHADAAAPASSDGAAAAAAAEKEGAEPATEGGEGEGDAPAVLPIAPDQRRLLHWHWANLEYGCSARLEEISAPFWNQDEDAGGFGGAHCMVVGGYDQVFKAVAAALGDCLRMGTPVVEIRDEPGSPVVVVTAGGEELRCDAVVVTAPLGVLKAGAIRFVPELPGWKQEAVNRLGFGDLNKVVLEFPTVFWNDAVDYFGAAGEPTEDARGRCFMWWNFHRFSGANTLAALVSGAAARAAEDQSPEELKEAAMAVLRRIHPGVEVPEPTAYTVSMWASEPYTRGSYSFVAVGASGQHYDTLAQPVGRRLLFAGEHTAREHPDTVGGAMLSGLREAARLLDMAADEEAEEGEAGVEVKEERELSRMDSSLGRKRKLSQQQEAAAAAAKGSEEEEEEEEDMGDARPAKPGRTRERGAQIKRQRSANKQDSGEAPEAGAGGIWHWIRQSDIGKEMDWEGDEEEEAARREAAARQKDAGKKKRRRGRDGEVASEDDLEMKMEREYAAAIGKEKQYVSEEQRLAQRDSAKEVVRALMLSGSGDLAPLRQLLQRVDDAGGRTAMLHNLRASADAHALQRIAADEEVAGTLASWLEAAAGESAEVALVDALLRVLRLLPLQHGVLDKSGLLRVLRTRCIVHSDPDARKLSLELNRKWSPPEPAAAGGAAGDAGARPGSRAGSAAAAHRPPAKPAKQQQQQQQQEEEDVTGYIDEGRAAELALLEQQAQQAAAAAAQLRAELEASQAAQQAAAAAAQEKETFLSFQAFRKENKGAKKKPLTKLERVSKAGSSGGGGGGGSSQGDASTRQAVSDYVGKVLQSVYEKRLVTREQCKLIHKKAVAKVMEREPSTAGKEFLIKKKRDQIKELVMKYVERQRSEAGGGGSKAR
ncbi:hypothetical protein ABPG75_002348 [Micractinium tetrahymenae]